MKSILLCIIVSLSLFSQEDDERDTQGKDFWLTFMPNTHVNNGGSSILPFRDSLYIFVASNVPTSVNIEYTNGYGETFSETIEINDVFEYETFKLAWFDYELPDAQIDPFGAGFDYNQGRAPQSFHITSDEKITVIAHNQAVWSSDGMIVYPTPTLGKRYFVNSYNSYVQQRGFDNQITNFKASQFAIVATEDNTQITIDPSGPLSETGSAETTAILNRGEVYLAQASSIDEINDLTGTYIESDKPIAVFSGNERAYVPREGAGSKDYLTAQMIPFESSGRRYVLLPFISPQNQDMFDSYNDVYRVLAYYDETEIYVNGELVDIIDRGEIYENITVDEGLIVEANKTISVYQLKKSTNYGSNLNVIGDPFMLLNVAESQFYNSYKVINFQANEYQGELNGVPQYREVYSNHYVSFAIKEDFVNSILFDFQPLDPSTQFEEIPNSDYVFTTLEVDVGTHLLTAEEGFICYAYGYGYANSYGFVGGGLKMQLLDHQTPTKIVENVDCYFEEGIFTDSAYLDSGIRRIEVLANDNIDFQYDISGDSIATLAYEVSLIDEYQDGEIIYRVYDEFGLWLTDTISIQGFTVDLLATEEPSLEINEPGIPVIRNTNFDFEIINYGSNSVIIDNLVFDDDRLELLEPVLPYEIEPNERLALKFLFTPTGNEEIFTDEIIIVSQCSQRKVRDIEIKTWNDEDQPEISSEIFEDCETTYLKSFEMIITDQGERQFGLKSVEIEMQENLQIQTSYSMPNFVEIQGNLIDPRNDGIIRVVAIDSADNEREYERVISGLTLSLGDNNQTELDFGEVTESTKSCQNLSLTNYGDEDILVDEFDLGQNPYFSIPAAQFPIIVPANSTYDLQVCFKPEFVGNIEEIDVAKIILEDCLVMEIDLKGRGKNFESESNSRCELEVRYFSSNVPTFTFADRPFPNPITDRTTMRVGFPETSNYQLELYTAMGNKVADIHSGIAKAGIHEFNLEFPDLENGSYFLVFSSGDFTETKIIYTNR